MWQEATAAGGKVYYYHSETKETTWVKPEGFVSEKTSTAPAQNQHGSGAADGRWGEAVDPNSGRTYYYHSVTNERTWTRPEGYVSKKEQEAARGGAPEFVAGGAEGGRPGMNGSAQHERRMERRDTRDSNLPQRPSFDGSRGGGTPWTQQRQDEGGFRGAMPKSDDLEYASPQLAEEAFMKLLQKHNISPNTTWEDALRVIIREREFRALKDPLKRKQAFEKYRMDVRAQEKSKEKERRERLREEFRKMLQTHEEIKHYSRWKSIRPIIEREAVFKQAGSDDERRELFEEYLIELKRKHVADTAAQHQAALPKLKELVETRVVDPQTKWEDARGDVMKSERYTSDPTFSVLSLLDVFNAFQQHVLALDKMAVEEKARQKEVQARRDREARDAFKQLLQEKVAQRKITVDTKWSELYPSIERDERFTNMISTTGSSALDLFFDAVERLRSELRSKSNDMLDAFSALRYEATPDTTFDQFVDVMRSEPRTARFDNTDLEFLYKDLMDRLAKRTQDERSDASRQERKAAEALRGVLRRMDPPIRSSNSYEDVADRLAESPEFRAVSSEGRRQAFDKHIRRLKEKEEDYEHGRPRRGDRPRDRDRERDPRNGSRREHGRDRDRERDHDRESTRRTRSPEVDAYEADRRKAQAERERQYHRASFGLTPPPRDRRAAAAGDDNISNNSGRDHRRRGEGPDGHYDRERRDREAERERSYTSRADPRDRGRVLDYGDEGDTASRPSSTRKRRDSEASMSSRRETKRRRRTRTPEPAPAKEEEEEAPQLQSGSEEGEIEEV